MNINFIDGVSAYPNEEAHKEVGAMMARGEKLSVYFSVDRYGAMIAQVEGRTTTKFAYQLNKESIRWLIRYMRTGESSDLGVDPLTPMITRTTTPELMQRKFLMAFVTQNIGIIKVVPAFRSKPGRLTAFANLKYGQVGFFVNRDSEIEDFMREHNLLS